MIKLTLILLSLDIPQLVDYFCLFLMKKWLEIIVIKKMMEEKK